MSMGKTIIIAASLSFLGAVLTSGIIGTGTSPHPPTASSVTNPQEFAMIIAE